MRETLSCESSTLVGWKLCAAITSEGGTEHLPSIASNRPVAALRCERLRDGAKLLPNAGPRMGVLLKTPRLALCPLAAFCALFFAGCQLPSRPAVSEYKPEPPKLTDDIPRPEIIHTRAATPQTDSLEGETASAEESLAQINQILAAYERHRDSDSPGSLLSELSQGHNDNSPSPDYVTAIETVSAEEVTKGFAAPANPVPPDEPLDPGSTSLVATEALPVDLPTILRLAGGQNWAVQLAWERINEAEARVTAAEALWIPSLNFGIGATKHEGQIQSTTGQVVDVSRNSLFIGGGAKTSSAPMTGGAGGPARLFVDLSIADALFQPLVARQLSCAAQSRHAVEFNDAQLTAAMAYFDLVSAQGEVAIVRQNLTDSEGLLRMTEAFVAAGRASPAEVSRVQVIVANQQQALVDAELKLKLSSSELIRIVRLDPSQMTADALLYSADSHLLPLELIPEASDLDSLIVQGQHSRPEVAETHAIAQARLANARSQELRPFIPNLNLAMSAGGFGGGPGSDIDNFDVRADFDAILVWELRNLGIGEKAARCESTSRYRQAVLASHQTQDRIAAEVQNAWHKVEAGRQRMNIAQQNVQNAIAVLEKNLSRIRGLEGLPLEAIQALNAVSNSRLTFLNSIVAYNKAQAELLRSVGRPVASGL